MSQCHNAEVDFASTKEPSEKSCVFSCLLVTAPCAICVISFEPFKVQTCSPPQNDHLNLSFVKGIYVDNGKLAKNSQKMTIYHFVSSQVQKTIFAFCVMTFEPIKVQTHSAPQNDHLSLGVCECM